MPPRIAIAHSNLGPNDATWYLDQWAQDLIQYAKRSGYQVVDIGGSNLVYERMTQILEATRPAILFNFSHGCRTYLIGNDNRCTLTRGWEDPESCGVCGMPGNLKSISGMAVVAYSCHSGAQLGKCAVAYGSPAYVGFSDRLLLTSDQFGTQNIFKDALMPLAYHILEGWSVGKAIEGTKTELLEKTKLYKPIKLISVPMHYNSKYLVGHGDMNWKLVVGTGI